MSSFPEFSRYGYRVKKELGSNRAGGRVTYLAVDLETLQPVVIKQFQFARSSSKWVDYDAYSREIQVLKSLDHPGIPQYLNSFHTQDGFCMVQEYKHATSLAYSMRFSADEVKRIAVSILEILIYLQNRIPPVIHRDIKPDNILVDENLNVYLIDFGFARLGNGEVGVSSVVKGTLGFMPPEQLFNRQLTEASDLYGLGVTLICLLTHTPTENIGSLIDISYRISFQHLVPHLSTQWVNWLTRMVEPESKDRFPNAAAALKALPHASLCSPAVQFYPPQVQLAAGRLGELLTQTVKIDNLIPDTKLEGFWDVAPHPSDPRSGSAHAWIRVLPVQIHGNLTECQIIVDTSKLMAGKRYVRQILLCADGVPEPYALELQVQTAPLPTKTQTLPYGLVFLLFLFTSVVTWLFTMILMAIGSGSLTRSGFGASAGAAIGLESAAWMMATAGATTGAAAAALIGVILGIVTLAIVWMSAVNTSAATAAMAVVVGLVGGILTGVSAGTVAEDLKQRRINSVFAIAIALLATAVGTSIGLGLTVSFLEPYVLNTLLGSGLGLGGMLVYLPLKQVQRTSTYRRSERWLIKP